MRLRHWWQSPRSPPRPRLVLASISPWRRSKRGGCAGGAVRSCRLAQGSVQLRVTGWRGVAALAWA
jgi:hypothetical protein